MSECGFVVELPSADNDQKVIIVSGKDTVQCFPTAEQAQLVKLCQAVEFKESRIHSTEPRTVDLVQLDVSTTVATCETDPEDPTTLLIKTKVIRPFMENSKRMLETAFFERVPEHFSMKEIGGVSLSGTNLLMRRVNFSRWEIKEFVLKESGSLNGLIYGVLPGEKNGSFRLFVPGYPQDFLVEVKSYDDIEFHLGKWVNFHLESDCTINSSKGLKEIADPFPTRKKNIRQFEILVSTSRSSNAFYAEDLKSEVQDFNNALEKYNAPPQFLNQKLWLECSAKHSDRSAAIIVAEYQEQLGRPKSRGSPPRLQSPNAPQKVVSVPSPPLQRGHNPNRQQPANYKFVKPSRKLNPDGTPVLPGEEKRPSDDSRSISSTGSTGGSISCSEDIDSDKRIAQLERKIQNLLEKQKKTEKDLDEAKLQSSRRETQIDELNKTNRLLTSQLARSREREALSTYEYQRGMKLYDLMKIAMYRSGMMDFLANWSPKFARDLDEVCNDTRYFERHH